MADTKSIPTITPPKSPPLAEEVSPDVSPAETRQHWPGRLWETMKRYPIPFGSVALLMISLGFWLAGRNDLARWTLLAVVLLGGIPLLWETVQQFLHKEFSVD